MSLLEIEDLRTGYGALPVLQGISFSVEEGETAVMFGLNGAGKTTTVNAIAGLLPAWSGQVRLDGKVISGLEPPKVVAAGIGLSPEGRRVFPALSVLTNLKLGAWTRRGDGKKATDERIERVFSYFPRLEERKDQLAGTMSGGEQQMLSVARAVTTEPSLLILDEMSMGLAPLIVRELYENVARLKDQGIAILIIEQFAEMALQVADFAAIMGQGRIQAVGEPAEIGRMLSQSYLGGAA